MRYSILAFAATATAVPFAATAADLCPTGLFGNPQCCATDVLGAADLNCALPNPAPASVNDFISICAAIGQQARCCAIPVANQAVLCQGVSPSPGGGGAASSSAGGAPSSSAYYSSATSTPTKSATPTPTKSEKPTSTKSKKSTSTKSAKPTSTKYAY